MKSLSRSLAGRLFVVGDACLIFKSGNNISAVLRKSVLRIPLVVLVVCVAACGGVGKQSSTPTTTVPTSLAIAPATALQSVGATQQFTATATFSDNSTRDVTSQVNWASSATSIATIAQSGGLEIAVAPGDVTISASFTAAGRTVKASTALHVTLPVIQSIAIDPTNAQLELGANQNFTATGTLPDGTTMDLTQFVAWSSGDQTVLRVNMTGGRLGLGNTGDQAPRLSTPL